MGIDTTRIRSIVESLIFVSDTPLSFRKLRTILEGVPTKDLKKVLDDLVAEYQESPRGITIESVAEGYQMRTRPENHEWIKMLVQYKPVRLSKAALETLAIIAYQQPVAKPDIEQIRGVDCSSGVSKLLEMSLIKILGRKEVPGRPFIYGTTPEFLEIFNLSSLDDLPNLKEIEDINPDDVEAFAAEFAKTGDVETSEDEVFEDNAQIADDETSPVEESIGSLDEDLEIEAEEESNEEMKDDDEELPNELEEEIAESESESPEEETESDEDD